jgi:hypothetical protein
VTEHLTEHHIANTVCMLRTQLCGSFLLVEGDTDARFYKRFVVTDECFVVTCHGKETAIAALSILESRSFTGVLAVVDADFDRLDQSAHTSQNLCLTDYHDLELMLIASGALDAVLIEYASETKRNALRRDFRALLLAASVPVGYLRWASVRGGLGLRFEGLPFSKFLDRDSLAVKDVELIRTVRNHSQALHLSIDELVAHVAALRNESVDAWQISCGHDAVSALGIALTKLLGSHSTNEVRADLLGRSLRLAYSHEDFGSTDLYQCIKAWESRNPGYVVVN